MEGMMHFLGRGSGDIVVWPFLVLTNVVSSVLKHGPGSSIVVARLRFVYCCSRRETDLPVAFFWVWGGVLIRAFFSHSVETRSRSIYSWTGWSRLYERWRSVGLLSCKTLLWFENSGERPIKAGDSWFHSKWLWGQPDWRLVAG